MPQLVQLTAPPVEYRPAAHAKQDEVPVAGSYEPAEHAEHEEAPAPEYVPATQLAQAKLLVEPVDKVNVPAEQSKHETAPVDFWY